MGLIRFGNIAVRMSRVVAVHVTHHSPLGMPMQARIYGNFPGGEAGIDIDTGSEGGRPIEKLVAAAKAEGFLSAGNCYFDIERAVMLNLSGDKSSVMFDVGQGRVVTISVAAGQVESLMAHRNIG